MLADNLTLFQSQINDIQDVQGFDPDGSLVMDQSIVVKDAPFRSDESMVAGYRPPNMFDNKKQIQTK